MEPFEIRRLALSATAKVTMSAALMGCGGIVSVDEQVAAAAPPGHAGASGSAGRGGATLFGAAGAAGHANPAGAGGSGVGGSGAAGASGASGNGGVPGLVCGAPPSPPFPDAVLACCAHVLSAAFPDGVPPEAPTAETIACCGVAVKSTPWAGGPLSWDLVSPCCAILEDATGPACSPWGPPMPPEVSAAWLEELVA